jgi:hypothetical protein
MSLGPDHLVQLVLLGVIAALGALRARDLGARAGLALGRLEPERQRVGPEAYVDALAAEGEASVAAELARAASEPDELSLEVAIREQQRRLARGLRALRVLGAASTALGFCGALFHVAWISRDHGLLDLAPLRVARAGLSAAALSVALGVGGSGLAVSTLLALSARGRQLARDLDAVLRAIGR